MAMKPIIVFALTLLLLSGVAVANDLVPLPGKAPPAGTNGHAIDDVWLSRTLDFVPEYYLGSGGMGDTMSVHYAPITDCIINSAEAQFFNAGTIEVYIWEYSDDAEALYPSGVAPPRGSCPVSPYGDVLFGPHTITVTGSNDWEQLFGPGDLPGGGIAIPAGQDFVVGFVKMYGEEPQPLADDISSRGTSYTWFCGPWMNDYDYPWGGYHTVTPVTDIMMRVDVTYTGPVPPDISGMSTLPDTPNPNKSCHVSANVYDEDGVDLVFLILERNGNPVQMYEMEDDDLNGVWDVDFVLNGFYGDTFTYWIHAIDNLGYGGNNQVDAKSFQIVPVANKPILIVDRGMTFYDAVQTTLNSMGWQFDYWKLEDHGGVDKDLLNMGWDLVMVMGFGNPTVPTRDYGGDPYSEYLMGGGNMVFVDQDYFYANGEPAMPTFGPGDFAYDFFGLAGGVNDPQPAETEFLGQDGNPISGDWFAMPFMFMPPDGYNWTDVFTPVADGNEQNLFMGAMYGEAHAHTYINMYGGEVAAFGFDPNFASPDGVMMTADWQLLMENLRGWFGVEFGPFCLDVIPWKTVLGYAGGMMTFDVTLENLTDMDYPGLTLWWDVVRPNGMMVEDLYSETFDLMSFGFLEWMDFAQCVPGYAPQGRYELVVSCGYYPEVLASDSYWFYKAAPMAGTASQGDELWFGVDPEVSIADNNLPREASLSSAWPNPFNPSTSFTLTLPETGKVQVQVFNVMGQQVATLADGTVSAGTHTLILNADHLSSGVYFVRAALPGQSTQLQKVMLVR